jgi:glycosyltransferase involved in cell wall biosynthesis
MNETTSVFPPEKSAVLLVAESLRPGGMTTYARALMKGLTAVGLTPRLCAPDEPAPGFFPESARKQVHSFSALSATFLRPLRMWGVANWAREQHFVLIHGLSSFSAPACQYLSAVLQVPYLLTIQHYQDRGDISVDRGCHGVLASSESIRENLVNDARVPKELIQVVPLGIELPPPLARGRTPAQRPVVTTCAPLTRMQDVTTFVRAAREISTAMDGGCQFVIVGEGPEESSLRKLARQLQLGHNVVFSHEGVSHDQVLRDTDVYVQTPLKEGFGFAVLEAMAHGRPVVSTSVGGLLGLVRDGQTGYLVPPEQPATVAEKVLALLKDPAFCAQMGDAARACVARDYPLNAMVRRTVRFYASVLGLREKEGTGVFLSRPL